MDIPVVETADELEELNDVISTDELAILVMTLLFVVVDVVPFVVGTTVELVGIIVVVAFVGIIVVELVGIIVVVGIVGIIVVELVGIIVVVAFGVEERTDVVIVVIVVDCDWICGSNNNNNNKMVDR